MVKSVDRAAIVQAVKVFVAELEAKHSEIERVIWFGSWVNGLPTPGSDVDICLILSASDKPIRERSVKYLPVGFPVGMDLFAYTRAEFERLREKSPTWYATCARARAASVGSLAWA